MQKIGRPIEMSQIFEVRQAHPRTILVKVTPPPRVKDQPKNLQKPVRRTLTYKDRK